MTALLLLATRLPLAHTAEACAIVQRVGLRPQIVDEEALIVFDAQRSIEHFVRRADFRDTAADFGFLVPTPSRPEIAAADEQVFRRLARIYTAPVRRRYVTGDRSAPRTARPAAVRVVEVVRVAGLEGAVLAADDPSALTAWLRDHGYTSRPALTQWLAPYVARRWLVTAFRIDPGAAHQRVGTRSIRMSFQTDRPVFPYAEPPDVTPTRGRVFRVTVVSDQRVEGRLGDARWRATTGYAGPRTDLGRLLRGSVPPEAIAQRMWMTTFEERSSARGADDLYFAPAPSQRPAPPSLRPGRAAAAGHPLVAPFA